MFSFLIGCARDHMSFDDDVAGPLDVGSSYGLMTPYVLGARFEITARPYGLWSDHANYWRIASSDPDVLFVEEVGSDRDAIELAAEARGPGFAELVAFENENERNRATIEVAQPDGIDLIACGDLMVGSEEPAETLRIVEGGSATWQVRWRDGERLLSGAGALQVPDPQGITLGTETSPFGTGDEWLRISVERAGTWTVPVSTTFGTVEDVVVEGVPEDDIAGLVLADDAGPEAREEEDHHVLVRGVLADGGIVDGLDATWAEGNDYFGTGNLLTYIYDPDVDRTIMVRAAGEWEEIVIHGNEPEAGTSPSVGCTVLAAPLALGPLALLVLATRRSQPHPQG